GIGRWLAQPSPRWHPRWQRCSRSWRCSSTDSGVKGGAMGGAQIAEIDGAAWNVSLERSGDDGATGQENLVQRVPTGTPQKGLALTLYGDDSVVPPQDSDVTVRFVHFDRQINPHPSSPGFRFILPPGSFRPLRPLPQYDSCCHPPCIRRGSSRVGTAATRCDRQRRLRRPSLWQSTKN